jgi:hypothetical protein
VPGRCLGGGRPGDVGELVVGPPDLVDVARLVPDLVEPRALPMLML